jgi:DNA-binding CsgD family transcriptional regulator
MAAYRAKERRRQRAAIRREERWVKAAETAAARLTPKPLTAVERGILELAEAGATVPETARKLARAPGTIEGTVTRLNKRFGTTSRVSAAEAARSQGLLGDPTPNVAESRRLHPLPDLGTRTLSAGDPDEATVVAADKPRDARDDVRELLRLAFKLADAAGVDIDEARRSTAD